MKTRVASERRAAQNSAADSEEKWEGRAGRATEPVNKEEEEKEQEKEEEPLSEKPNQLPGR